MNHKDHKVVTGNIFPSLCERYAFLVSSVTSNILKLPRQFIHDRNRLINLCRTVKNMSTVPYSKLISL